MKIDRLETHDRLEMLHKQKDSVSNELDKIIASRPFGEHAFYVFMHARTVDMSERAVMFAQGGYNLFESVPTTRLVWQPRLTKPKAQTNSQLFKVYPGRDMVKVIWVLPPRELWPEYVDGNMCENKIVSESIHDFQHNREKLERSEDDDLSEQAIVSIYRSISVQAQRGKGRLAFLKDII